MFDEYLSGWRYLSFQDKYKLQHSVASLFSTNKQLYFNRPDNFNLLLVSFFIKANGRGVDVIHYSETWSKNPQRESCSQRYTQINHGIYLSDCSLDFMSYVAFFPKHFCVLFLREKHYV